MINFRFDDSDQYVNGTPYAALSRLRRDAAFAWHSALHDPTDGFWLVTKHRDVTSISKNPRIFETFAPLLADPIGKKMWSAFPSLAMIADNLMTFEEKKHQVFRAIANCLFSTARISAVETQARSVIAETMARVSKKSHFDFAAEVALTIAVQVVLGKFLGIPPQDIPRLMRCTLTINAMDDPVFRPRPESLLDAADELYSYGISLKRRLEKCPGKDPISELLHGHRIEGVAGDQLFLVFWFPLVAGAFDTTASTIAGGVHALLQFPEQLARVQRNPALIPGAVDEMLRWVSPVIYFRRTATSHTEFHGEHVQRGQKLILCYASANRDAEVFPEPDTFDVGRTPNNHVSFGYGPHFCVGARLATLILRVFFEESLTYLSRIRLNGRVTHTRSFWMNRLRSMPVSNS